MPGSMSSSLRRHQLSVARGETTPIQVSLVTFLLTRTPSPLLEILTGQCSTHPVQKFVSTSSTSLINSVSLSAFVSTARSHHLSGRTLTGNCRQAMDIAVISHMCLLPLGYFTIQIFLTRQESKTLKGLSFTRLVGITASRLKGRTSLSSVLGQRQFRSRQHLLIRLMNLRSSSEVLNGFFRHLTPSFP